MIPFDRLAEYIDARAEALRKCPNLTDSLVDETKTQVLGAINFTEYYKDITPAFYSTLVGHLERTFAKLNRLSKYA